MSWLPTDAVANAIVDLVVSEATLPPVLNLVHPCPVTWQAICQSINKTLARRPLPIVPFSEWLSKVEQRPTTKTETEQTVSKLLIDGTDNFHADPPFFLS